MYYFRDAFGATFEIFFKFKWTIVGTLLISHVTYESGVVNWKKILDSYIEDFHIFQMFEIMEIVSLECDRMGINFLQTERAKSINNISTCFKSMLILFFSTRNLNFLKEKI